MRTLLPVVFLAIAATLALQWSAMAQEKLDEPPDVIIVEPIIIEGERIKDQLTPEEIRKKFRDALGDPTKEILSERWVSNDTLLITSKGVKYCVKFVPPHLRSSIDPVAGFAGICKGY
ncbi:MAG: hypothetical protein ACKVQK_09500 [Burkholderiales bacterium]